MCPVPPPAKGEAIFHWEVTAKVFRTFFWFSWQLQLDYNAQSFFLLLLFFILPKCRLLLLIVMGGVNADQPGQVSPWVVFLGFFYWFGVFFSMLYLNSNLIHLLCKYTNRKACSKLYRRFVTSVSQHPSTAPVSLAVWSGSTQAQQ